MSRRDTEKTLGFSEENVRSLEASPTVLPGIGTDGPGLTSGSARRAHERIELAIVGVPEPTASSRGKCTPESRGLGVGELPGCAEPLIP